MRIVVAVSALLAGLLAPSARAGESVCDNEVATITGTDGDDRLTGTAGDDVIAAHGGTS